MECFWADGLFSHIETIRQTHHGGQVFRPASRISFGYGASTDWIFTLPAKGEGSSEGLNVATAAITVSTDSGGVAADGLSSV